MVNGIQSTPHAELKPGNPDGDAHDLCLMSITSPTNALARQQKLDRGFGKPEQKDLDISILDQCGWKLQYERVAVIQPNKPVVHPYGLR